MYYWCQVRFTSLHVDLLLLKPTTSVCQEGRKITYELTQCITNIWFSTYCVSPHRWNMRSRNMQGPDDGHIQPTKCFVKQDEENTPELSKRKIKIQRDEKDGRTGVSATTRKPRKPAESQNTAMPDLSRKDLLHLLGVMEGEVQVWTGPSLCISCLT